MLGGVDNSARRKLFKEEVVKQLKINSFLASFLIVNGGNEGLELTCLFIRLRMR